MTSGTHDTTKATRRVESIDALRGLIMVIMALDHVRDFVHRAAMSQSPTNLATTTPLLFLTRWITHVCAPVFMFTAGLGAYLWWKRNHTRTQLSTFLVTRGLWLILLELTVMRLAYDFNVGTSDPVLLLVFWALGACMIVLAALAWLPETALAVLAVAAIALHNLLDPVNARDFGDHAMWWNIVHQVGAFKLGPAFVIVGYPLIPWVAVMALGFTAGKLFTLEPERRQQLLVRAGLALTVTFIVARAINRYGDPAHWSTQSSAALTVLSFLNTTKYPPSLVFLCMTLGPALLALAWFDRRQPTATNPLVVLGRAPLFYFVAHFMLAHLVVAALAFVKYGSAATAFIFTPVPSMGGDRKLYPPDFGDDLWVVYLVWIAIVVALYPACRWWANAKATNRNWWWRYL